MSRSRLGIGGGLLVLLLIVAYILWPSAKPLAPQPPVSSADGGAKLPPSPAPSPTPTPIPQNTLTEPPPLTLGESQALRNEVLARYAFLINNREGDKQLAKATYDYLFWEKKKAELFQGKCCPDMSDPAQELGERIRQDRQSERIKIVTAPPRRDEDCSHHPGGIRNICDKYHRD